MRVHATIVPAESGCCEQNKLDKTGAARQHAVRTQIYKIPLTNISNKQTNLSLLLLSSRLGEAGSEILSSFLFMYYMQPFVLEIHFFDHLNQKAVVFGLYLKYR